MIIKDSNNVHMTGHITDKIYDKDGNLIKVVEGHNLVVNQFVKLVMALCKGEEGYNGIQYWAIGSGNEEWDTAPIEPAINASRLDNEIGRVAIDPSEIKFLSSDYTESEVPTNMLEIKHTFGVDDCNGEWREFGIFGGNATDEVNSGIMVNKRHHPVITKTTEMTIERTMRFTLNLS